MSSEERPIATYEERRLGWHKAFVLYRDRVDVSYRRLLGTRGEVSVPLARITDVVEHYWEKDARLHVAVFTISLLSGAGVFVSSLVSESLARLGPLAPYVLVASVVAPLLFSVIDPRRIDHLRVHLSMGGYLSIAAYGGMGPARDEFCRALMERVRAIAAAPTTPAAPVG